MNKNPIWTNRIEVTGSHPCDEKFISEMKRLSIVIISPIKERFASHDQAS
jgi:hypothetical protein